MMNVIENCVKVDVLLPLITLEEQERPLQREIFVACIR
jgi:hypothetical protein